MPNPTKRHTKSRRGNRRSHDALKAGSLAICPKCKEPKLPHRVCPSCGFYNGRVVLQKES